ncbi:MAG: hypothetical protein BGN88_04875 [Clostridiales bacterium 43-6]|nr:MAG: hypothetical protein BGN88_04875 [Clostridiales bacterium 43-6]
MKKSIAIILIFILAFVFTGCSTTGKDKSKEAAAAKVFNVGEEAKTGDTQITVTKVERSAGTEWDKPEEGNEYVIVRLKIENVGKETIDYNPLYFKLKNSEGQLLTYSITFEVEKDKTLDSGDLAAGGKKEGSVVFKAKKGDANLELQYFDNILEKNPSLKFKIA